MRYRFNIITMENFLIKTSIILVICLYLINIFHLTTNTSTKNNSLYNNKRSKNEGTINLSILGQEDLSKIILTINGKPIILDNQSSRLSIVVKDYDIIQIIGNDLNAPSKVRIDGVTKNIILPEVGLEIDIDNRIQLLTKVRLK